MITSKNFLFTLVAIVAVSSAHAGSYKIRARHVPSGDLYVRTVDGAVVEQDGTDDPVENATSKKREACLNQHAVCFCHEPVVTSRIREKVISHAVAVDDGFGDVVPSIITTDAEASVTHADVTCDGVDDETLTARLNDCDDPEQMRFAANRISERFGGESSADGEVNITDLPMRTEAVDAASAFNQNWCSIKFTQPLTRYGHHR